MIYLLTGPDQTGKTTALAEWADKQQAAGLLQTTCEGRRYLKTLRAGETRALDCVTGGTEETIRIGRFRFSASALAWGRRKLLEAARRSPEWLLIDEVGPLELRGEGLAPAVETVLRERGDSRSPGCHTLLVVRGRLLNAMSDHYAALEGARVIRPGELSSVGNTKREATR
jgi:nucleoside-triphosphatase THEP1